MRVAAEIVLTGEQKSELDRFARGRRTEARLVLRARIVLLAAVVHTDLEIAERLGVVPRTAARWRSRFLADGAAGLQQDAPRPGRTPAISAAIIRDVIEKTTQQKPSNRTHWSTRTMAAAVGISEASVRRIWRAHGLKPHRVHTFKLSNDPRFAEKLEDVVGLYLNPPEHALVLSLDEKSQIQALDRTQPGLPMKKGRAQTMTHDYKRYGTTTLFAALNTLDGTVMATCMNRHRHQEWLKFLRLIDRQTAKEKQLHLIVDNYATHKHPNVLAWAERHPRFHFHFTPTSSSWLNMIERFFRDLTENQLQRGVFTSVEQLQTSIFDYIQQHNTQPKPFIWTAKATDILEKVKRGKAALHNCPSA
ncbi:MAG TPA: IS630 family transposase [Terracidiphilus sp.]|nr:IS630 family transposase [Terracidiphilus sp.]